MSELLKYEDGVVRPMTEQEIEAHQISADHTTNAIQSEKLKEAVRAAALAKLGLTADEIAALFG